MRCYDNGDLLIPKFESADRKANNLARIPEEVVQCLPGWQKIPRLRDVTIFTRLSSDACGS